MSSYERLQYESVGNWYKIFDWNYVGWWSYWIDCSFVISVSTMNTVNEGDYVLSFDGCTILKVVELVETDTKTYAVVVDSDGWPCGAPNVKYLTKVNVRVEMVERWTIL